MIAIQLEGVTSTRKGRNSRFPFYVLLILVVAFASYMAFEKFDDFVKKEAGWRV